MFHHDMNFPYAGRRALSAVLVSLLCLGAPAAFADATLTDPGCARLTTWAAQLDRGATFAVAEGLIFNERFADTHVEPLFGVPLMRWQNDDTTALQGWLSVCRQEAVGRKDTAAGNALYAMLKETRNAYKALRQVWTAQRKVRNTVDRLTAMDASPDAAKVFAIGVSALRGEDTSAAQQALPPRWTGYGREAAQLVRYAPLLPAEDRDTAIAALEQAGSGAEAEVAQRSAAQDALLARIAAVPVTAEGRRQLRAIAREVDPTAMSREDYAAYNAAMQGKQLQIRNQAQVQAAAEAQKQRSLPAPAVAQVDALLIGDDVDDLEFRDLPLNQSRAQLAQRVESRWQYKETASLSIDEAVFAATRNQRAALMQSERRGGGAVSLRTHDGAVGRILFVETYPGPISLAELEAHLRQRFGAASKRQQAADSFLSLVWENGARVLRVEAGPRVPQHLQNSGVQSSMTLELSDEDFVDYLAAAAKRCEQLRGKPRDKLGTREAQALVMGCIEP